MLQRKNGNPHAEANVWLRAQNDSDAGGDKNQLHAPHDYPAPESEKGARCAPPQGCYCEIVAILPVPFWEVTE